MSTRTIVLIEDDSELQLLFRTVLTRLKINVISCVNIHQIKATLLAVTPDLIITDLSIEGVPVDSFATLLLNAINGRNIPLIITSGREDIQHWKNTMRAIDSFKKPVDIRQLAVRVQNIFSTHEQEMNP